MLIVASYENAITKERQRILFYKNLLTKNLKIEMNYETHVICKVYNQHMEKSNEV